MTPYDHIVNSAERAILTFKNHTISGLCICDKAFPSILWCKLIKKSQDTLNMLHTSRVNPKLLAFHVLRGQHDFNRVPFGTPGTRGTIFNPPETIGSYGPRALDCWYIGPAWGHYRGMHFQIPSTAGYRTSSQYKLYPRTCPNTEGNPNVQGCEDRRITHKHHPKYLKLINNKHGEAWPSFRKISTYI